MIRWYENIPLFSWLALRGRCAGCRQAISWRYPLVELLTGAIAVLCVSFFGPTTLAAAYFLFLSTLLAIALIILRFA